MHWQSASAGIGMRCPSQASARKTKATGSGVITARPVRRDTNAGTCTAKISPAVGTMQLRPNRLARSCTPQARHHRQANRHTISQVTAMTTSEVTWSSCIGNSECRIQNGDRATAAHSPSVRRSPFAVRYSYKPREFTAKRPNGFGAGQVTHQADHADAQPQTIPQRYGLHGCYYRPAAGCATMESKRGRESSYETGKTLRRNVRAYPKALWDRLPKPVTS